jgi:putative ABC transport system permease protein
MRPRIPIFVAREILGSGIALAVAVAFVASTHSFVKDLSSSLVASLTQGLPRADVFVYAVRDPFEGEGTSIDPATIASLARLPAVVEVAEGGSAPVAVGARGERLVAGRLFLSLAGSGLNSERLALGRWPGSSEVAVAASGARLLGLRPGSTLVLQSFSGDAVSARVSGVVEDSLANGIAGAVGVYATPAFAASHGIKVPVTALYLKFSRGLSESRAADMVRSVVPSGYLVYTRQEAVAETEKAVLAGSVGLNLALDAFGLVAVVVAAFVVGNSARVLLVRKIQMVGLLSALGATRGQIGGAIAKSTVSAALPFAVGGAVAGVVLAQVGFVAVAHRFLHGLELRFAIDWVGVVEALAAGLVVALLASWAPARAALAVPPVEALRFEGERVRRTWRLRWGLVIVAAGAGAALILLRPTGGGFASVASVVLGGGMCFLAVAASMPMLMTGLGALLVRAGRVLPPAPALALRNTRDNAARSSVVATSLMLSLTLLSLVAVMGYSVRASLDAQLGRLFPVDFVVSAVPGSGEAIPSSVVSLAQSYKGVSAVALSNVERVQLSGPAGSESVRLLASSPGLARVVALPVNAGSGSLPEGGILLSTGEAKAVGAAVGDYVSVAVPGRSLRLRLVGTYADKLGLLGDGYVRDADARLLVPALAPTELLVRVEDRSRAGAFARGLALATRPYGFLVVQDVAGIHSLLGRIVSAGITGIDILLGFSLLIGMVGVANAESLSILERVRELGLLRALGMRRGELAAMVILECLTLGGIGLVGGVVLGVVGGFGIFKLLLAPHGLTDFSLPGLYLAALSGACIGALLLAALVPVARASQLSSAFLLRRE